MKRTHPHPPVHWRTALLLLLFTAASCSETVRLPQPDTGTAIGFSAAAVTRAPVTSLDTEGAAFDVWATAGTAPVFAGERVHRTTDASGASQWTYDSYTRYWQAAAYRFGAVYPSGLTEGVTFSDSDGTLTIGANTTPFDVTQGRDLMAALHRRDNTTEVDSSPVRFTFHHLLALVKFQVRLAPELAEAGMTAKLTSLRFYGMPKSGTCTVTAGSAGTDAIQPAWAPAPEPTITKEYQTTLSSSVPATYTPAGASDGYFMIPGSVAPAYSLEIEVTYTDTAPATYTLSLATAGTTAWEAGKRYQYSVTLGREYIYFSSPVEVEPWEDQFGGTITVTNPDTPQP